MTFDDSSAGVAPAGRGDSGSNTAGNQHQVAPTRRYAESRLEVGSHLDPVDLAAGKYTPDGVRVPKEQQAAQAAINQAWMARERDRLQGAKGDPVAWAAAAVADGDTTISDERLAQFLATRAAAGNAGESDLKAKAARAQAMAVQLAEEYSGRAGDVSPRRGDATSARDADDEAERIPRGQLLNESDSAPRNPLRGFTPPARRRVASREEFAPVSRADMDARGWDQCDFILITGDAYVDHPSFANGVLVRVLEWAGYRVGVIAQPAYQNEKGTADISRLGAPRLGFLVSAGNLDSLLNAYTAHKLPRSDDPYSPGGAADCRPKRATIVYCNLIRRAFGKVPIIIGGIEASQRRFSHYDYWDDKVRRSVLLDSNADLLVFGMGEAQLVEIAHRLAAGEPVQQLTDVRGTAYVRKDISHLASPGYVARFGEPMHVIAHDDLLPPAGEQPQRVQEQQPGEGTASIQEYRRNYAKAFRTIYNEQDPVRGHTLVQRCGALHVIQLPPAALQSEAELDRWYDLPYTRQPHPDYAAQGGIPAWETTRHSIITHRGCMGSCTFCAIWMHQGRTVQSRSVESIVGETESIAAMPGFRGTIADVGGPTANMYGNFCSAQQTVGACQNRDCLLPDPCPALRQHLEKQLDMLQRVRNVPGVKKAFIASGIRHDMLIDERVGGEQGEAYIENLAAHHTSGHLKVAPEHTCDTVLAKMRKPSFAKYEIFRERFIEASKRVGKEQYLVAYFVSSHPGSTMDEQIRLAEYFRKNNWTPEQVQDFIPTPMTPATVMFYTGLDPETLEYVYTPTTMREKRRQRALMQSSRPEFHGRVRKALREAGRNDLIGHGKNTLVPPGRSEDWDDDHPARPAGIGSGPESLKDDVKRPASGGKRKPGHGRQHHGAPRKPARGSVAKQRQRRGRMG
ncbi:MAG: YgiQ family radical SAM protein [Planctomycetota bacterium]